MDRKFIINGIGCIGCIARVKRVLEEHPAIEEVEIYLNPKGVSFIKMNEELSTIELQNQLDKIKGYTITEIN